MNLPKSRNKDIVILNLEKETLIYDFEINKAFALNETASIVYHNCDGKTSFAELKSKYNFTDDLIFFTLDELNKKRLIETNSNYQSPLEKFSRREIVRKIGLSTMIALPLISSVVAPTAVSASSACVTTGCTQDNYKQANCCGSDRRCFGNNQGPGFGNCQGCYARNAESTFCAGAGCCSNPAVTFNIQNACCSGSHREVAGPGGSFNCVCN